MRTAINSQARGLLLVLLGALGSEGFAQTNTSKPVFYGNTKLQTRVGENFRYQILVGGKSWNWLGSDNFSSAKRSKDWLPTESSRGGLTNANGQLNLFAASSANASNPALGTYEWAYRLPRTNSWLAYMQVVVTNNLPVTDDQYAAAGLSLFQANQPDRNLILTNDSEVALLREATTTNRVSSAFILNNLPFTGTFSSNTANFYLREAVSPLSQLVFSNLGGPTNTLFYRSSTRSSLSANSNGVIVGSPGPGTALASPRILLPSGTNWTLTVRIRYEGAPVTGLPYLAAAIVKNQNSSLLRMFTNRVVSGFRYMSNAFGSQPQVAPASFASGTNFARPVVTSLSGSTAFDLRVRFSYNSTSAQLTSSYDDLNDTNGFVTNMTSSLLNSGNNLGQRWNFNPGRDSFRLLLVGDNGLNGGNGNGSTFKMYFTDLQVTTEPADDDSVEKNGSTVWVGLLYDATTTNLVQQCSPANGDYTDLTNLPGTGVGLGNWGTNVSSAPLKLRIGAQAGLTNLTLGGVALRTFAIIPPPGDMVYSSPDLPGGLTLDPDYGVIEGTPTNTTTTNFSVVASNPFGGLTTTQSFSIQILPTAPQLQVVTSGNLQFGATNNTAFTVRATNAPLFGTNPLVFTASNLPAGITLLSTIGGTQAVFGGVPTSLVGTNNRIVFTASNALAGAGRVTSVVSVLPRIPSLQLTQISTLPGYAPSGVDLSTVYWRLRNNATGQNTNAFPSGFLAISNFPTNALRLNPTNGEILARTNRFTNPGIFNVTFAITNAGGSNNFTTDLVILPSAPVLALATNPVYPSNGIPLGASSNNFFQLVVDTNAAGYSPDFPNTFVPISGAPSWLNLNSSNGMVSGSNNLAGIFNLQFEVDNAGPYSPDSVLSLTLTSLPAKPLFRVSTNRAQVGSNSSNALVFSLTNPQGQLATNDLPVTWTSTNLPSNFSGAVVGTNYLIRSTDPTEAGVFSNITVVASNLGGATTNSNISLTVLPATPLFTVTNNGPFQVASSASNAFILTVTNTSGQNTNFPIAFTPSNNLPSGWSLTTNATNRFQAVIGNDNPGTPLNTNLVIQVGNQGGTNTTNLTLQVLPLPPAVTVSTNHSMQVGNRGSTNAISITVLTNGQNTNLYPVGFSAPSLPGGLTVTTNATNRRFGFIGGSNPTQAGIFSNVAIVVTNRAGTNSNVISLTVLPALPSFRIDTNRAQFASNSPSAVVVEVTNTNGQNLTNFPLSFSISNLPGGLALTNTNDFIARAGSTNPSVATNNATFTVVVSNLAGARTNTFAGFRILPAPPVLLAETNVTPPFRYGIASASNAVTIAVTNTNGQNTNPNQFPIGFVPGTLPSNLSLVVDPSNSLIASLRGTPQIAVITNVTVRATNMGGTGNVTLSLPLLPAPPQLSSLGGSVSQYLVTNNNAITFVIENEGAQDFAAFPIGFSSSNLPTGFGLSTNTNPTSFLVKVTGAPSVVGIFNDRVITATNAGGSNSQSFSLTVRPLPPTNFVYAYGPTTNDRFRAGASNNTLLVSIQTNGQNTNDFPIRFTGSSLPAGLTLTTNGLLSGTPSVATTYQSVFTASNIAGLGTNTNAIPVLAGAAEIVGPTSLVFSNLTTNEYFRYQVSARGAGQIWAGRSDFTNALTDSWVTNGASNSSAHVSTNAGALRYVWSTTNTNSAHVTWNQALPLDTDWQVSVKVNFASNTTATNLAGLGFVNSNQYVEANLFAFKDSSANSSNYSLAFFLGDSNQPSGYLDASGATNAMESFSAVPTNAAAGLAYLGLTLTASNNQLVSLGNPNETNAEWVNLFTNHVSSWTNAANSNSLVLRLQGGSLAPTNTNYSAEFSDFVIVPLGNLTYSASNLPAGLTLNTNTGLISGRLTSTGTNTATIVISNAFGTVTNTIEFRVP